MLEIILIIFTIYITLSIFFFIFPTFIHHKKTFKNQLLHKALSQNKILNIAHRGGPRHATQNTIQLFTFIQNYTNCFEMDVCETADNILVVHHDHHLNRTCGIDRDIQEFKYEQLPIFMNQIVLDFGVKQSIKTKKQKIPKLEDIFKKFPHMLMNIQLKTPTQSAIVQFTRLIHEHQRVNNTIIGIRNHKNLQLKKKYPCILNFFNDKKVFKLAISYFLGFAPFLKIQQNSLQIPVYSKQFQQWNVGRTQQQNKWKIRFFMRVIDLINIITRPLIWHLKRRGIIGMGWVCNTQQGFRNAIKAGFQGIMTDDPILLKSYLNKKKLGLED